MSTLSPKSPDKITTDELYATEPEPIPKSSFLNKRFANLMFLSFGFMVLFSAFNATQVKQPSIWGQLLL